MTETTVWVKTEPTIDGKTYVVTLEASDDTAVTLNPDRALRYAAGVLAAAHRAAYDAAVARQFTRKVGVSLPEVAPLLADMRADRPPLDPEATAPLNFEPGVNKELEPFLIVSVNGQQVGQWTFPDAEEHARFVLAAVAVADLDAAYYRVLIGAVGLDEPRARTIVDDLANWRDA